ncbi:MAG: hypothetical protein ACOH14_07975 [Rhodoglobus sp.]
MIRVANGIFDSLIAVMHLDGNKTVEYSEGNKTVERGLPWQREEK